MWQDFKFVGVNFGVAFENLGVTPHTGVEEPGRITDA